MVDAKTNADAKIAEFADEMKKQFEVLGAQVKEQLINDFDKILTNDLESLKDILKNFVINQSKYLLSNSNENLQKTINKNFNGSIFGSILTDAILPNLLSSNRNGSTNQPISLNTSSAQQFLEIGKAIANSQAKNG